MPTLRAALTSWLLVTGVLDGISGSETHLLRQNPIKGSNQLSDWLISLEGTPAGEQMALYLAILAAFLHAVFGALQKGRHDPWLSRGAIDAAYALMAAPFALFVVPWPEPHMWPIFAGVFVIHICYKMLQATAYTKGAYTVVYPVVRGTGPLFAVIGAYLIFDETFSAMQ